MCVWVCVYIMSSHLSLTHALSHPYMLCTPPTTSPYIAHTPAATARMKTASPFPSDISRCVSPATRMMESGGSVDWSFAIDELLKNTGKDIIEERWENYVQTPNNSTILCVKFTLMQFMPVISRSHKFVLHGFSKTITQHTYDNKST